MVAQGSLSTASAIAMGYSHTCAVTTTGGVKCWGYNGNGQLGDSTTTRRLTPVNVSDLSSEVSSIAAGWGHTCALTTAGGVKCWGRNQFGQLGNNSNTASLRPVQVEGLVDNVLSIAAGVTISMLPMVALYLMLQRRFIEGITAGALKS